MNNLVQLKDLEGIKILDLKQYENNERDRPEFDNKFLKIYYFVLNEGLFSTLRKYFAHKIKQQRFLTCLILEIDKLKYFNISIQYQENPNNFVVTNKFYPVEQFKEGEIEKKLDYYFDNFNQFSSDENYGLFNIDVTKAIELPVAQPKYESESGKGLFIYGLGGYVKMFIIHHFKTVKKVACIDYKSSITSDFQKKYGFKHGFLTPKSSYSLLKKTEKPIAIIATYHSDHSSLAYDIFQTNPNTTIFIEKPPTVTLEDLDKLLELFNSGAKIEIGFNRRFIDFSKYVKERVQNKRLIVTCSIKEVIINHNHWYLWKNQGTRITGNVVHWFDLANWWIQSKPVELNVIADPADPESSAISVLYENGSILNLTVSDKGNSLRGVQEKIEVRFENQTIFIDDFTSLTHLKNNGVKVTKRKMIRDKGHNTMYDNFLKIIEEKEVPKYSPTDLIHTAVVTYHASEMIKMNIRNMNIGKVIDKFNSKVKQ
jgi:predicted dehydrogenase